MSKKLPYGYRLSLDYNWDSTEGAEVMFLRHDEDFQDMEEVFHTDNLPGRWHNGHFNDDDVKAKFGAQFERAAARERKKMEDYVEGGTARMEAEGEAGLERALMPGRKYPRDGGPGKGWHNERARHSVAAKKGKRK